LEVTQRIHVRFTGDDAVRAAVAKYREYITTETLSLSCEAVPEKSDGATDWDLNGHGCSIIFRLA
jgi:hypothetical protein